MNVAFLLVATAWLAGADDGKPAAPPAQPAPAVAPGTWQGGGAPYAGKPTYAPNGGCCSSPCQSSCCETDCCEKHGLLSKLRGLFHRHKDCCESSCQPVCKPVCVTTCNDCCDSGCGRHKLRDKLKGLFARFHKNDCCEDSCCASSCNGCGNGHVYGPGGGTYMAPKPGEQINAPKEAPKAMPSGQPAPKTSYLTPAPRLEPAPAPKIGFGSNTSNPF